MWKPFKDQVRAFEYATEVALKKKETPPRMESLLQFIPPALVEMVRTHLEQRYCEPEKDPIYEDDVTVVHDVAPLVLLRDMPLEHRETQFWDCATSEVGVMTHPKRDVRLYCSIHDFLTYTDTQGLCYDAGFWIFDPPMNLVRPTSTQPEWDKQAWGYEQFSAAIKKADEIAGDRCITVAFYISMDQAHSLYKALKEEVCGH
jgi:hypothetical protein